MGFFFVYIDARH